jgi:hypothetical protein
MNRKWNNVSGSIVGECEILFTSSGSHHDMSMYGGPDRVGWPEEHNEERSMESVTLSVGKKEFTLPKEAADAVFEHFGEEISEAELDWPEDCDERD